MANGREVPAVSILTSFYNAAPLLREAAESVFAQSWPDWEWLLVDDGSTDSGAAFARDLADRHPGRVRYLDHAGHANLGIPLSRNAALRASRGDYVAILDADDVWAPEKLSRQLALLERHPEVDLTYGAALYWHSWDPRATEPDIVREPGLPLDRVFDPPELLLRCYPLGTAASPCPSDLFLRRRALEEAGGFEASFAGKRQYYEDQALLAKIYLRSRVFVSSACWTRYRRHAASCSSTTTARERASVRGYYLDWLEAYLAEHRIASPAIHKALGKARRQHTWQWLKAHSIGRL